MDRRSLLKGVAALGAGLLLPPSLAENVEAVTRRYWALDSTMVPGSWLEIPRGDGLWRVAGDRWIVDVLYSDGKREQHAIDAPERRAKIRLHRDVWMAGVSVIDADTGVLRVGYGRFWELAS
jgi:hypothetical protein